MLTNFEKGIICLLRSGLTGEKVDLPPDFDIERIYPIAKSHHIRTFIFHGALNSGIDREQVIMLKLYDGVYNEMLSNEKKLKKYRKLTALFEENGIDYMPLKGIFLRELYPKPEMRCMGDLDILIQFSQYEKIREILIGLGFEHHVDSDHELIWYSKDGVCLELHKRLIPSYNKDYYAYFSDGWENARRVNDGGYLYRLSPEDDFVYLFTHFSKHYRDGGIGIKHFSDLYLYLKKKNPDRERISEALKSLGLYQFYLNVLRTLEVWFEGADGDEITELISRTVLQSGAFGLSERKAAADVLRKSAKDPKIKKGSGIIKRIFLPYKYMCIKYPYLKKLPILLPVAYVIRIFDTMFNKPQNIKKHINKMKATTPQKIEEYDKNLKAVGLEYNFEE